MIELDKLITLCFICMYMKEMPAVVSVRIKGKILDEVMNTEVDKPKEIIFRIDRDLYNKFEYIVGKGNITKTFKKFVLAVVNRYEKLSLYKEGKNERQRQEEG